MRDDPTGLAPPKKRYATGMTASRSKAFPRVALLVETSTSWGQQVVCGVGAYAREHGPWMLHIEPRGRDELLSIPPDVAFDGVIARVNHARLRDELIASGIPAVDVSWYSMSKPPIARCMVDTDRVVRMAYEHFRLRGFESFAYCPLPGRPVEADPLAPAFDALLRAEGRECPWLLSRDLAATRMSPTVVRRHLRDNLAAAPKPLAVFAFNDVIGRTIAEVCLESQIPVPQRVAILGNEQDQLSSAISNFELSTIDQGAEHVGYGAAGLLDRMMQGAAPPKEPLLLEPVQVVMRASTDTLATNDPIVGEVCQFMMTHMADIENIETVLDETRISRRALEKRFNAALGRSPAATLRLIRVQQAHRLLLETPLTIEQVARRVGYDRREVMSRAFRAEIGASPSEIRRRESRRLHAVKFSPDGPHTPETTR